MYLNWWRHTLSENTSNKRSVFAFFFFFLILLYIYKTSYSIRVKKSIKSADEALLQYVNSASGGHGESEKIRHEIKISADDQWKWKFRRYPQTCFWARVKSTWGDSWSLPALVCHTSGGYSPWLQQDGSGEQRSHSCMQAPAHNSPRLFDSCECGC